ncbi:phosphoglucomutase/phosphomannomutase family protein [Brooklawnia cerclae]|uniref:Phosphomannomutase n=1 Tax=Brooklawnia cerclae TaxID=349934 RepID=A0ABX0SEK3_9ACTN|nr:phosphoglucomutase/phosphomannomutase family protein [Brooklawnia cerclae]NIH56833.1 phosphomannomutase [Brooklawnia cerclae]
MIEFGTGGWRAIIADGFTKQNVRLLAQGLANRILAENVAQRGVVIGYDRRFLSGDAARWAAAVLVANQIPVTLVDRPAPTPMIMWTTRNKDCAYGLAVTASHNPAIYNGIKVFTEGGRDADVEVTRSLQDGINGLTPDDVRAVADYELEDSPLLTIQRSMNWYIDSILAQLNTEVIRHSHLKVVLDPMFGVSQTCLQTILMTARCDVDVINSRHDPLFGGRLPSPNVDNLHGLRREVLERHADLGIATDGDADRLGIIDDKGNYLSANQILVLLYRYLLAGKGWQGPVVRNIATTSLLDRVAARYGQECHEVPVGFKYISAKMAETDAVIGGESSGGLTVRGHIAGKDGVYAASLLVEMIASSKRRLSELWDDIVAEYGSLEMIETAYSFTPHRRVELTDRLFERKELPAFPEKIDHVSYQDGCKVYFENGGWVVIRFSGTEPLLRVFSEMPTLDAARENVELVASCFGLDGSGASA